MRHKTITQVLLVMFPRAKGCVSLSPWGTPTIIILKVLVATLGLNIISLCNRPVIESGM